MNLFNKKTSNQGFTIIEMIVVVSVLATLVLLGAPRLTSYVQEAQLTRIQHDTKVMEQEMGILMVKNEVDIGGWKNNNKDFNQLIAEEKLFGKEGAAERIYAKHLARDGVLNLSKYFREITSSNKTASLSDEELGIGGESYPVNELPDDFSVDKTYKVIPEEYYKKINTKLKGTFYVNSDGKVYYEHGKPIPGENKDKLITWPTALPEYEFEHEAGTIIKWHGAEQYLTIPSHFLVDGEYWPVRIIGVNAFVNGNFRRVVIPDTVVKIERDSFKDATIDEIVIPHSVQHIADGAFSGGGIDKVEVIGEPGRFEPGVFVGTQPTFRRPTPQELDIVIHPESGTVISSTRVSSTNNNNNSSSNSNNNQSVNTGGVGGTLIIPEQVEVPGRDEPVKIEKIHKGAFQGEGLIKVHMPYTLKRIEAYAFAGNQLNGVEIPHSVEYIGEYAFAFNQRIHSSNNKVRPTIKSIKIKDIEHINNVEAGNIVDNSGTLISPLDGVEMKEYIWVTDADNFKFDLTDVKEYTDAPLKKDTVEKGKGEILSIDTYVNSSPTPSFSGLGPEAFDGDLNSYTAAHGKTIKWSTDLTHRTISIRGRGYYYGSGSSNNTTLAAEFKNASGQTVSHVDGSSRKTIASNLGSIQTTDLVVPEGATSLYLYGYSGRDTYNSYTRIYEVSMPDTNMARPEAKDLNITHSATDSTITLSWDNPYIAYVYKNGRHFRTVNASTHSFSDGVFYPSTEQIYKILFVNNSGNGTMVTYKASTAGKPNDYIFSGLGPEAFDGDLSTNTTAHDKTIKWSTDLTHRTIRIRGRGYYYSSGSSRNTTLTAEFKNASGQTVSHVDGSSRKTIASNLGSIQTTDLVVPEGATSLYLYGYSSSNSYNSQTRIYEVSVPDTKMVRPEAKDLNITHSATDSTITLSWDNPHIAYVYKNGRHFRTVNASTRSFSDGVFYPSTEQTYKILFVNDSGNGTMVTYKASTAGKPNDYIFSGLGPEAFDGDLSTNTTAHGKTIKWSTDLTHRTIRIRGRGYYYSSGSSRNTTLAAEFKNASGQTVSHVDGSSRKTIASNSGSIQTADLVVPEGATSLYLYGYSSSNSYNSQTRIYEVLVPDTKMVRPEAKDLNITHSATDSTITLSWDNPHIAYVYKNGRHFRTVNASTRSFSDGVFYPSTEQTYKILFVNNAGNGTMVTYKASTAGKPNHYIFSGLGPEAFDGDLSTNTTAHGKTIKWSTDLTHRTIRIRGRGYYYSSGSSRNTTLAAEFKNASGRTVSHVDGSSRKTIASNSGSIQTTDLVVPEGATSLYLYGYSSSNSYNSQTRIYEVSALP